jgi:hypothetical protein
MAVRARKRDAVIAFFVSISLSSLCNPRAIELLSIKHRLARASYEDA